MGRELVKVTISGNTFPVKEQIKAKGLLWNMEGKNWERELIIQVAKAQEVAESYKFEGCRTVVKNMKNDRIMAWTKDGDTKPPAVEEGEELRVATGQTELQRAQEYMGQIRDRMHQTSTRDTEGQRVRVRMPAWLARQNNCLTVMEGTITTRSRRAVYFVGNGVVDGSVTCARCGRELTNDVSRLIGIGPTCCAILGIDRAEYEQSAQTEEGREYLQSLMRDIRVETWLPISRIRIQEL
jgi:hypothetical protein